MKTKIMGKTIKELTKKDGTIDAELLLKEHYKWIDKARANGWTITSDTSIANIWLRRDGWIADIPVKIYKWASIRSDFDFITIWADDGLQIDKESLYPYSEKSIKMAKNVCVYCHKWKPKVKRLGFAGRACTNCHKELVKKVEYTGWYN